ncbi:MAG: hypothetical protein KDD34_06845, partial [Bdellovibrionales bacterium]|nr:hypothetical protein [Bdellovibrionales bacterium]
EGVKVDFSFLERLEVFKGIKKVASVAVGHQDKPFFGFISEVDFGLAFFKPSDDLLKRFGCQ